MVIVTNGHCPYIRFMQTALHIMALVTELEKEIVGGAITSTEFYKKQRTVYFFVKGGRSHRVFGFSYHPTGYGVLVVPPSKVRIDTREKPWPVFNLEEAVVTQVKQLGFDRIFQIFLNKDGKNISMLIEALGPNGNIWLLDDHNTRLATLRKRAYLKGDRYKPPPLPDKIDPRELSFTLLKDRLGQEKKASIPLAGFIQKNILGFDSTLSQEIVVRSGVDTVDSSSLDSNSLKAIIENIHDIVNRFEQPEIGYLYHLASGAAAYPLKLSAVGQQPEKFKSLSLAVLAMIRARQAQVEAVDEKKCIKDAVKRAVKRLERRFVKIERDIKEASDYKRFKRMGELLQINFDKIKKGRDKITLEDVYTKSQSNVTIPLDPALSPSENVKNYFKKYRKGRQGLELLQRRLVVTKQELARLSTILSELEDNFESACARYDQEITPLLPAKPSKRDIRPRLPYREYTLSTGVRIFVGRGGADNDRTTFEFTRPYELWFHTQQCAGSHVVMKFPNKSFEPSKAEIEEAAAVAAYHSKAKSDSLVPVIYTLRRYVRKPRKVKSGLVTVEREKSIMVAPQKPT